MFILPKSFSPARCFSNVAGVGLLILTSATLADVDSTRGEALYENHCGGCHADNVHKREDRRVKSMDELRTWVSVMSAHTGQDWREEDVGDVAFYLNLRLYRFDE